MKKVSGSTMILIAMAAGIVTGFFLGEKGAVFAPLGDIFILLIKMVIIPLVFFSIISGAAALGETKSAGKVGLFTIVYYLGTSAVSVILGLLAGSIFKPGLGVKIPESLMTDASTYAENAEIAGFWETIMGIIPENPFESLVSGNILQILFFALFFGISLSVMPREKQKPVLDILDTVNAGMIWMIRKILMIAPIGVFGLMVNSIALFGMEIMRLVLALLAVFSGTLAIIHFGIIPLLVMVFGRMNPLKFLGGMKETQILAFASASSMATLPVNKQECEDLGVKPEVTSFVLPLGATINMNGNAMLYALTAMFFSQMFGVELGMAQYVAIVLTSVLGAIGTAGVPGPALLVVAVLVAAGIPLAGLPLIFGVDRLFDMMRTSTNVLGDASCAIIVDKMLAGEAAQEEIMDARA
ncbi:dicarboxylate/amino acid:cation symporter [Desulfonema ishimotonii]|uniref:Dicarboxylate/amino acid:cation symporter n=1 Tax=Desulfonema ishimotonii TaxID=45657 RepID=A0A401FU26_9BACT|nr:dicarboxylate/amino acid:cation symporter [Desulfonema ishimotonii]GBC60482.1 dicarboxylate/amino acid:cation symporter [Desulfonema ishimotonii]